MGIPVGVEEGIYCIQDIELEGQAGEDLCLAYKTSSYTLGLSWWISDDGYVLGVIPDGYENMPSQENTVSLYYPMPVGEELSVLQESGAIPDPVSAYTLTGTQYLWGLSSWIALPLLIAIVVMKDRFTRHLTHDAPPHRPTAKKKPTHEPIVIDDW